MCVTPPYLAWSPLCIQQSVYNHHGRCSLLSRTYFHLPPSSSGSRWEVWQRHLPGFSFPANCPLRHHLQPEDISVWSYSGVPARNAKQCIFPSSWLDIWLDPANNTTVSILENSFAEKGVCVLKLEGSEQIQSFILRSSRLVNIFVSRGWSP